MGNSLSNQGFIDATVACEQAGVDATSLSITERNLVTLPNEVLQMRSLTSLNVSRNSLAHLPDGLAALGSLNTLLVNTNKLSKIPLSVGMLHALTTYVVMFVLCIICLV
jgi:Leucine-rich repeat (LRR) protein